MLFIHLTHFLHVTEERDELVRRVGEVQAAHDAATQMNQQLQAKEGELRHNLQQAISKEEYARVTARVTALEEEKVRGRKDDKPIQLYTVYIFLHIAIYIQYNVHIFSFIRPSSHR